MHDLLYLLFRLMAEYSYTPKKWFTSATKLIYKPNKTDPHDPTNYRPIALMNCIPKLWTSVLTSIGTQTAESGGVFCDTADGFRSHRNIYDSLSTHIMMYEDAKISRRNIYTAYSDFKCALGGMDHRILFQLKEEYGFQNSYIAACKQIYSASNTYYMTIHGNTIPLPIYSKGTHRFFYVSIRLMYQENRRIDSNHDSAGRRIDTITIRLGGKSILS
jgi:hypothetical protein